MEMPNVPRVPQEMNTTLLLKRLIRLIVGLAGFSASLTVLFLAMRSVMMIGGYCAEGGAYEISVHCPEGVATLAPLSIFAMVGFAFLYILSLIPAGPNFTFFFWSALFGALGWNFLEFAVNPPFGEEIVISWIVCGVLFMVMGVGPLCLFGWKPLIAMLFGTRYEPGPQSIVDKEPFPSRIVLVIFHYLAVALGIVGGIAVFGFFTK